MNITRETIKDTLRTIMAEETEYQTFFKKALEKAGKSIPSMSDDEKKDFFNKIDAAWNAKGEKNEGNAFGAAVVAAKEKGEDEFEVGGKTYKVEESASCSCGCGTCSESINEGKHDVMLDKLTSIVKGVNFMNVGKELKKNGIKYSFSTSMIPMYKIDKLPIAIVNKKYAAGAEREVGDIAIGLLESINEADVVGKTIFSDGKGKLFFGYYKTDDAVEFVDYKTWKKLNFKDVSKGDTNKDRLIKAILKKQKQFNKKVEFNMWAKQKKRTFEETMDWFIQNGWINNINKGGIKESVTDVLGEGRAFINAARKAKEEGKTEFEFNGKTYPVTIKESFLTEDRFMNKKVKQLLDRRLSDLSRGKPNHQFAVMHVLMGALTDANFHSEAKKVPSIFTRAKYEGDPQAKQDLIRIYEELGEDIASICKWDGKDIVDAIGFYVSMTIGRPSGEKVEKLVESLNEARLGKISLLKTVENGDSSRVEGVKISPELAFELRMFLQRPMLARTRTGIAIDNAQMKDAIGMLAKVGVHKRLSSGVKKEFADLLKKYNK